MAAEPIQFYNRYTKSVATETIYGEGWLRFAYENPLGGLFVWALAKRALFSYFYGWKMNWRTSGVKVLPFIVKYDLDVDEFAKSALDFRTFNEFFFRALKKEARPIAPADDLAIFPADGRHFAFQNYDAADGIYVKGAKFSLQELLGSSDLAQKYAGGSMLISRLCPVDYHRFHFPCAGVPSPARLVNGPLYSVSPIALRKNISYLAQNKRMITKLASPIFGDVLCIEVGATNVGSIRQNYVPNRPVTKGEEKGLFRFGGSCVITLFRPGAIRFDSDLTEQAARGLETYAKMGDRLGITTSYSGVPQES